jgi:maleylpyruvate isomerase
MAPSDQRLRWFRDGEAYVLERIAGLSDADLAAPSRLPGWSRAHVVGHLARNADALGNLLRWAETGEVSPMYASAEERADGIEASAAQSPDDLRTDVVAASGRLVAAADAFPTGAWDAEVRTALGRPIPASEVPWMRVRETWVHAVDLDAGASFDEQPDDVVVALLDEVASWPSLRAADPALLVRADDTGAEWHLGDGPDPVEVRGPSAALLAWISGRDPGAGLATSDPSGSPPAPPPWL